jgi:hypothetical protein
MPGVAPFGLPGRWFKGSLHTHTTQSDGRITPAENMNWHAEHGYDFEGITDHNTVTDPQAFVSKPPLLAIPSVEVSARRGEVDYHVLCYGVGAMPAPKLCDPQEAIDGTLAAGGLAFVAHPYWHDLQLSDLSPLRGYSGIEIFNAGCWLEINKGHSLVHWDGLLHRGRAVWGIAADDSHWRYPDHGRGWVVVRSETLTVPAILAAMRQGHFYSTMGPEIYELCVEGDQVTVRCSPAQSIYCIGDIWHCPNAVQCWDGQPVTTATFTLHKSLRLRRERVIAVRQDAADFLRLLLFSRD